MAQRQIWHRVMSLLNKKCRIRLCPSNPRTPPRSVVLTDCPSIITTDGHAERPSPCADGSTESVANEPQRRLRSSMCGNSDTRCPHRIFTWQQSPLAAGAQQIEDGVEYGAQIGGSRPATRSCRRQQTSDSLPRRTGNICRIEIVCHPPVSSTPFNQPPGKFFKHPLSTLSAAHLDNLDEVV